MRPSPMIVLILFALSAAAPSAERGRYFEVINRSHEAVTALAVARAGAAEFVDKPLRAPLAAGGGATTIQIVGEGCAYDIKTTFADGRAVVYSDIDVCRYRALRMPPPPRRENAALADSY
ncbi:hypothetical protein [Pseudomonas sp. CGJS7]|uniref:hypothetical protein n=1 Tax=Pseudomonas sp. CGJS7 TaxID=3109348 RepID=UPI00300ABD9E